MLPELSFELDAISLSLDEECSYSDLMDMEVEFGDTLEMDLVINGTDINTDDSLVGNGTSTDPLGHNPADTTITGLKSVTDGGIVTDTIWTWLGATASSVLSVASNLITKVFNLYPQTGVAFTGAIDLTKVDTHYSNYAQTGVLEITIAANSIIGGSAEITITANGSAITVTGATQYGDTAIDYTNGKINHFLFTKFSNGIYYSVKQLN